LQGHLAAFLLTFILLLLLLSDKEGYMSARRQLGQRQQRHVVDVEAGLQACCSNQTCVFVISSTAAQ
jgi:hypothetical protein